MALMRIFHRIFCVLSITYSGDNAHCLKGKVTQKTLTQVADLCRQHGIPSAEIWLTGNGRVNFSREIPKSLHQRFRNVVVQGLH